MSESVERLKGLLRLFEATQSQYRRFGAQDTEPDGILQQLLVRAIKGKKPKVPTAADDWELYSDMKGRNRAVAALREAATACVQHIESVPIGQAADVETYLRDYCWRVSW